MSILKDHSSAAHKIQTLLVPCESFLFLRKKDFEARGKEPSESSTERIKSVFAHNGSCPFVGDIRNHKKWLYCEGGERDKIIEMLDKAGLPYEKGPDTEGIDL